MLAYAYHLSWFDRTNSIGHIQCAKYFPRAGGMICLWNIDCRCRCRCATQNGDAMRFHLCGMGVFCLDLLAILFGGTQLFIHDVRWTAFRKPATNRYFIGGREGCKHRKQLANRKKTAFISNNIVCKFCWWMKSEYPCRGVTCMHASTSV